MGPLPALTVTPCTMHTTPASPSPAHGPYRKVPIRMGTSAGSYSRNGAAGMSGKWMRATSSTASAASMPRVARRSVFCFVFVFMAESPL